MYNWSLNLAITGYLWSVGRLGIFTRFRHCVHTTSPPTTAIHLQFHILLIMRVDESARTARATISPIGTYELCVTGVTWRSATTKIGRLVHRSAYHVSCVVSVHQKIPPHALFIESQFLRSIRCGLIRSEINGLRQFINENESKFAAPAVFFFLLFIYRFMSSKIVFSTPLKVLAANAPQSIFYVQGMIRPFRMLAVC